MAPVHLASPSAPLQACVLLSMALGSVSTASPDEIEKFYRQRLKLHPASAEAHRKLADALWVAKGDLKGAKKSYRRAIKLLPYNASLRHNLGHALQQSGDLKGAEGNFRKAIQLEPTDATSRGSLGRFLASQGNIDGAVESLLAGIRLSPTRADIHYGLGDVLMKQNDLPGAEESYKRVLKLDPKHTDAMCQLANVLRPQGHGKKVVASTLYNSVLKLNPGHEVAAQNLALLSAELGDADLARKTAQYHMRLVEEQGRWPLQALMTQIFDNEHAANLLAREAEFLDAFVAAFNDGAPVGLDERIQVLASTLRRKAPQGLDMLPEKLRRFRELENTTAWVARTLDSCHALGTEACQYGITWFQAWVTVMAHDSLQGALSKYISSGMDFTIGGSALGYQCFFASLGLGIRCLGYDLQCHLVSDAQEAALSLTVGTTAAVNFACADVLSANLSQTGVLWLNDQLWSRPVRRAIFERAAVTMPESSTIISYQALPHGMATAASLMRLVDERVITAAVSWDDSQKIYFWKIGASASASMAESGGHQEL